MMMSKFKTYLRTSVSVCKRIRAYVKAIVVLIKAVFQRMTSNGFYEVSFMKIGRKWYCDVPDFPKELFEHTLMVGLLLNFLTTIQEVKTDLWLQSRLQMKWRINGFVVQDYTRMAQL